MNKKPVSFFQQLALSLQVYVTRFLPKTPSQSPIVEPETNDSDHDLQAMRDINGKLNSLLEMEQDTRIGKIEPVQADTFKTTLEVMRIVIALSNKKAHELSPYGEDFLAHAAHIENKGEYPLVQKEMQFARKVIDLQQKIKKIMQDKSLNLDNKAELAFKLIENFSSQDLEAHLTAIKPNIPDREVYNSVAQRKRNFILVACVAIITKQIEDKTRFTHKLNNLHQKISQIFQDPSIDFNDQAEGALKLLANFKNQQLIPHLKDLKKYLPNTEIYNSVVQQKTESILLADAETIAKLIENKITSLSEQLNAMITTSRSPEHICKIESNIRSCAQKIQALVTSLNNCTPYLTTAKQDAIAIQIEKNLELPSSAVKHLEESLQIVKANILLEKLNGELTTLKYLNKNSDQTFQAQDRSRDLCVTGIIKVKEIINELQQIRDSLDDSEAKKINDGIKDAVEITTEIAEKLNKAATALGFHSHVSPAPLPRPSATPKKLPTVTSKQKPIINAKPTSVKNTLEKENNKPKEQLEATKKTTEKTSRRKKPHNRNRASGSNFL